MESNLHVVGTPRIIVNSVQIHDWLNLADNRNSSSSEQFNRGETH
jgi:hypothetical protein